MTAAIAPETPSKKVASSFADIDVNATPSKKAAPADADDFSEPAFLSKGKTVPTAAEVEKKSHVADDVVHGKFVGEVDLPEEDEPLLVESSRRFVLFPIRFHEVSTRSSSPLCWRSAIPVMRDIAPRSFSDASAR